MVAQGDGIHTSTEQRLRNGRSDSGTSRRVFPIGHDKIQGMLPANPRESLINYITTRTADYISNEQQFEHSANVERKDGSANRKTV